MKKRAVVIHSKDNVATVVEFIPAGSELHFYVGESEQSVTLEEDIPLGHKVAIQRISKGADVIKYAESIGLANQDIKPGQYVHVHNMESQRGRGDLEA